MTELEKVKILNSLQENSRKLKDVIRKNSVSDDFPKIKRTWKYKKHGAL